MQNQHAVASLHAKQSDKKHLWRAAIKWPLYSVAVMPIILAAGWRFGAGQIVRLDQFLGFLFASVLLLLWENLTNDFFDAETGIDRLAKPHSVVNLIGERGPVGQLAYFALFLGLSLMMLLASRSNINVLFLVIGSCILGYLYQGPPFRWGYQGLGEPLCWLAFGPFATAAALLVIAPNNHYVSSVPWKTALTIGSGPALATTLVLFCSHFHQVAEDAAHGKLSPLVRMGTRKASQLVPWFVGLVLFLELLPVLSGVWPITSLLGCLSLSPGLALIKLLSNYHDRPEITNRSKFLAIRFQALNGLGLSLGFAIAPILKMNIADLL